MSKFLVAKKNKRPNKDSFPYVIEECRTGLVIAYIPSHFRHPRSIANDLVYHYERSSAYHTLDTRV
jgi:hypothetical protein